uniref:M16 family metallopeptidase n=1 Tax=Ancylomarina sp. TaxID=1970196 RepID=UPI0035669D59
ELTEGLSGNSSIQDFETLLKLAHLYFEKPRFDKEAFDALKGRYMAFVANMGTDINKAFRDSVSMTTTDHNPRTILFSTDMIKSLDFETMKRVYNERLVDASDFTFIFVGNIDAAKARPMIETYLGSIKDIDRKENWKDSGVNFPKKDTYSHFTREMETPKTSIRIDLHGDIKYTKDNSIMMDVISKLLSKRYLDVIREEEGGSYGVGVWANVEKLPREEYNVSIQFDTDPAKADKLKAIVYNEIQLLFTKGVKEDDLNEVKKNLIKVRQENLRKNTYWVDAINAHYIYNKDMLTPEAYDNLINSISKEKVEKFAKKYFAKPTKTEVVMSPKEKEI